MVVWDPWHRVEYRREVGGGRRVLEYTEVVEDNGWKLGLRGYTKKEWFTAYTRACAEDYLGTVGGRSGSYVVTVYRTGVSPTGEPTLLGAIRLKWPA